MRDHAFLSCGVIHFKNRGLGGAGSGGDILQDNLQATDGGVKDIEALVQDAVELVGHVLQGVSLEEEEGGSREEGAGGREEGGWKRRKEGGGE